MSLSGDEDRAVLERIRKCQDGFKSRKSYADALAEIRAGRKTSHWIWWVWPSMVGVRTTQQPLLLLPNLSCAIQYLRDPVLSQRLIEITEVARVHLERGIKPKTLFGSAIDAEKFYETTTLFAVAALFAKKVHSVRIFVAALRSIRRDGVLHAHTMSVLATHQPDKVNHFKTVKDLESLHRQ
eukprot:m.243773 g.243773  ORF g.243773 m.243773 type:complete len:182 (-) comp33819_c4_seq1:220-765(-)